MKVHDVDIEHIETNTAEALSDTFYRNCNFCNKIVSVDSSNLKSCLQLSGDSFFCPFCIRNNFHHKLSKNILIMSYRGIIGYYYWELYRFDNISKMWYTDILNLVDQHIFVGLENPVFYYDPSTFLWFLDFNRIGIGKKKAPIVEVKKAAQQILQCFRLNNRINTHAEDKMWDKYDQAIDLYYKQRKRPKDRKMLIPTLAGVASFHRKESFWEKTRSFIPGNLKIQ